jgi:hypothetical protein
MLKLIKEELQDIENDPKDTNDINRINTLIDTINKTILSIYYYCIAVFCYNKEFLSKNTIKVALENTIKKYGLQKFDNKITNL